MELKVINDQKSNKLQLHFSKTLNRAFNAFLRDFEIKKTQSDTNIYTADKIPAYDGFIENLQSLIDSGGDWRSVNVFPIFEETHESITGRKFTIVNIHYKHGTTEKKEPHIVFQLWENDVFNLARSYGRLKYGDNYVRVSGAKKYLKEGRIIFEEKKIINQSIIDSLKKEKTSDRLIVETEKKVTNSEQNKVKEAVLKVLPEVENNSLVIAKTIQPDGSQKIENVLVPNATKEPFQSGNVGAKDLDIIRSDFPQLLTIKDADIEGLTSIELFELSQVIYPEYIDMLVSKVIIYQELSKRGFNFYESLGYPSDLDYPHISILNGYKNVRPLRRLIYSKNGIKKWWRAIVMARPIADLHRGIEIIEKYLVKLVEDRKEYINPETNEILRFKGFRKKVEDIDIQIEQYKISKQNILDYLVLKNSNQTLSVLDSDTYQTGEEVVNELKKLVQTIIKKFEVLEGNLYGEKQHPISSTKEALQKLAFNASLSDFKNNLLSVIANYKSLNSDLDLQTRSVSNPLIDKLTSLLNHSSDLKVLSIEKEIVVDGRLIKNILVPKAALEPFESGAIDVAKKEYLKKHFPKLFLINDSNIEKATPIEIFRLLQLGEHKKFGIDLSYTTSRETINKQGKQLFKELGYPLHYAYPYVNIRHGYKGVLPLSRILESTSTYFNYDNVLANWRPIADVSLAKSIIDELLADSHSELAKVITNKNKFEDELDFKDTYDSIGTRIRFLENSLQHIVNYIYTISINQTKETHSDTNDDKTLSDSEPLAIVANIKKNGKTIHNVLVPRLAKQPFQSGDVVQEFREFYQTNFPELIALTDSEIPNCSSVQLFQLIQMEILPRFGITVSFEKVQQEFNKRAEQAFRELGFPTDKDYPYAVIKSGDFLVRPLGDLLQSFGGEKEHWAKVVEFARPIGDAAKALEIVEETIKENDLKKQGEVTVSPTTELDFESLEKSKQVLLDYLQADGESTIEASVEENDFDQTNNSTSKLGHLLSDVISELLSIEADLEGAEETIIATTIFDLEKSQEQDSQQKFLIQLDLALTWFKDWVFDLREDVSIKATKIISRLINSLKDEGISFIEVPNYLSIAKDIITKDKAIVRVLVPILANEPFQSGGVYVNERENLKINFPELFTITAEDLPNISGINLFRLSQMGHPQEYGIDILRRAVHDEIEYRGANLFEEIGFPTDMNYPYLNIHTGYNSIHPLEYVIDNDGKNHWWWTALEHWRPIADIPKATAYIDNEIAKLLVEQQEYINPKTKRVKTKKEYRNAYYNLDFEIKNLQESKVCLKGYLTDSFEEELNDDVTPSEPIPNDSYIDRVVVAMHDAYMNGQRLSKKKIENLQESTGAPSLGALWEAVELSWLLWYKRLYKLPLPFYDRLLKMDTFWKKIQPTYAYSDSSKELYKQYSTPCPIGAIIAQYTGMDKAELIFEPSAGNGLLLVGADPTITHVNEIDKSRAKSLTYQRFSKITTVNAALAFDKEMNKKYDVVVTNPPFAKWEDTKEEKAFIIREYFHNHRGMNHYIRLEHLMAGLALRTMKNNGRAAIIVMGHLSFGSDGTWKKYRPFFSWLYRHYKVDDVINMNSYKLYNKQGAVKETMLILIGGRKATPEGVQPNLKEQPELDTIVSSFTDLWMRVKTHILPNIDVALQQLKIAVEQ